MIRTVDDAVEIYRAASERGDIDALMEAIDPDAELVSPLSGHMVFRGEADLRVLLSGIHSTIRDLDWTDSLGEGATRVLVGTFRVGPLRGSDAMVLELGPGGRIVRMRPHLRPWLPTTLFALLLVPEIARHPSIVMRALR